MAFIYFTCGQAKKGHTHNQVRSLFLQESIQMIEKGAVSISRHQWKTDLYFL